jgi:organic radical activating enzyme
MTAAVSPAGRTLLISELFGPTIQGEGPSTGRRASFIRLSSCNLTCTWCDTPYTWRWSDHDRGAEQHPMSVDKVLVWAAEHGAPLFVITGGEPLLQPGPLAELTAGLIAGGSEVEIETNGTIPPPARLLTDGVRFNVAPKLANSGVTERHRIRPRALTAWAGVRTVRFKFVVTGPEDLAEVAGLQARYDLHKIWIMPEGTTPDRILSVTREVAEAVIARGWNLTTRLHLLIWGEVRGR